MARSGSTNFAGPPTRRRALRTSSALAAGLVAAGLSRDGAQQATPAQTAIGTEAVFVQTFASGSLFPTQGSRPNLPPYTLYLWEAGGHTIVVISEPERIAGLIPSDRFFDRVMEADTSAFTTVLVASADGAAASTGDDERVWVLRPVFAGAGSDPGSLTYQRELVPPAEAEAQLGLSPSLAPDGAENIGAGILFITERTSAAWSTDASERLHLP